MSWILGVIGENISEDLLHSVATIHPLSIHNFKTDQFYLASGGIPETCLSGLFNTEMKSLESGWLIVGLGIERKQSSCRFLNVSDWQNLLAKQKPEVSQIDGHFIAIRWQPGKVECFSDQLGLRTLYISRKEKSVIFSTRLDWVANLTCNNEIDFEQFGSHWLTFNQLSFSSLIKRIERLGPGGVAICTPTSIEIQNSPWLPNFVHENSNKMDQTIISLLNPEIGNDSMLSLGLSGGLDSRLLLACLIGKNKKTFSLHLFGHPDEPDVKVAQQIAGDYHFDQNFFPQSNPSITTDHSALREYVAKTCLTVPASGWFKLHFYPELSKMKKIMIDGGMGEIARRQFLNRIYWMGKKNLLRGSFSDIFPHIKSHHASIFNEETIEVMESGINKQLIAIRDEMPSIDKIGIENFLDLLIVRYRFPNYAGMDQSRIDETIINYMPYAQPSFLQDVFQTPLYMRRGGKLFRSIIHEYQSTLTNYPLVKGVTTYPYWFSTLPASLYTKVKTICGSQFHNPLREDFLQTMKEYLYDLFISSEVKTFSRYNQQALRSLVLEYFGGETNLAGELDWWLSFELWRQSMKAAN
jgi:hypothetical protein